MPQALHGLGHRAILRWAKKGFVAHALEGCVPSYRYII